MDHPKDHSMFCLGLPGIIYYITVEFLISIGIGLVWLQISLEPTTVFLVSCFFSNVVTSSCGGLSHQQNDFNASQGSLINVTAEGSVAHCWPDHGRADCCKAKKGKEKPLELTCVMGLLKMIFFFPRWDMYLSFLEGRWNMRERSI